MSTYNFCCQKFSFWHTKKCKRRRKKIKQAFFRSFGNPEKGHLAIKILSLDHFTIDTFSMLLSLHGLRIALGHTVNKTWYSVIMLPLLKSAVKYRVLDKGGVQEGLQPFFFPHLHPTSVPVSPWSDSNCVVSFFFFFISFSYSPPILCLLLKTLIFFRVAISSLLPSLVSQEFLFLPPKSCSRVSPGLM